jgi:hypothetical protein
MNGLIRKAGLFTLGALLLASMAVAGVPNMTNSSVGTGIPLGVSTTAGGSPDGVESQPVHPSLNRTFTIRDGNNVAVPNVVVTIDFSGCTTGEFRLCGTQTATGVTINCGARTVSATTDGLGQVTFAVAGQTTGITTVNGPCAVVTSLAQTLGTLRVSAVDDGTAHIGGSDVGRVLSDRAAYIANAANYRMRSDFDSDADVDGPDVGAILTLRAADIASGVGFFSCAGGVTCP